MSRPDSAEDRIDDTAVQRYFDRASSGTAGAVSMLAHEHDLPLDAVRYRLRKEVRTIRDWLDTVPATARVLDVGCGGGAWAEVFAGRYGTVVGVERSPSMVKAARERLTAFPNVEILERDARAELPDGPFDLVFLGGVCMYLNDADAVVLLRSLEKRLGVEGTIILRESTVPSGRSSAQGEYRALYRSVSLYHALFRGAGFPAAETRRNWAYTSMEMAERLVEARRKRLPFLPKDSPLLGGLTWWSLRGCAPISLWLLPRVISRLNITWPALQNHFFRLRPANDPRSATGPTPPGKRAGGGEGR